MLVFPGLSDVARLGQIAARIIERVGDPVDFEGQACRVSASIGMTTSTRYAQVAIDAMHADADEALYHSKRSGRGRVTLHREEVAARRGVGRRMINKSLGKSNSSLPSLMLKDIL